MSLDVYLKVVRPTRVFEANITHNLAEMAEAAGLYKYLWRPEDLGIQTAEQLIEPLKAGLYKLISEPNKFKAFNPENGWGNYENLVSFVMKYLEACMDNPEATVEVSR